MGASKIRLNDVRYRQGFLEVTNIHPGHINIETWEIHPDLDISEKQFDDKAITDECVVANTEIELSVEQAKALVASLEAAIANALESGRG
ncbi:hypothetical protein [Variovorax sp. R-27]|jgi:hypothetical protein|uniref:hypothetical protein n=1 Tax=Variovorax sp. R-27 TaxID=3404058 RepID=UPI003CEEA577